MRVAIGTDHGGYPLKGIIIDFLRERGHEPIDCGAYGPEPSDYPDFARAVAETVLRGEAERGILICGSGVGASVAANKFPGIRSAVCHDSFSAHQGVEDDNMNVVSIGARVVGAELAKELVGLFLAARFTGAERHLRRLEKVGKIERECCGVLNEKLG
ncbi:MAG: ribose 5-phosphate isomerase B [Alphaproteobacteria bacterium]|uniref:Ribose 5-phosphate isomerase B n=1 Tax=Candidatus Nitrobium versatile TaxID=2884831 RepID=A0A953LVZ9_9BACT|nr:ribose 5-phosphate isomerase B [Candidatus Nitrobium versatile]